MATRFLFNTDLWDELAARLRKTKDARVAVAYLGKGGSRLLPLRKGHRLIVDMSLPTVHAGTTDPREVKKLIAKGVQVFSRQSLHAKFFVFDGAVIAGSSNISRHAQDDRDEAALLTDDPAAVARAARTFDSICTEPVRAEYLRRCIKEYRPPRFAGGARKGARKGSRLHQAKLWIIGGLAYRDTPVDEEHKAGRIVNEAKRRLSDHDRFKVDPIHYDKRIRFFGKLRPGDWVIHCVRDGAGFDVYAPARFLGVESYPRGPGKRRYLVLLEQAKTAAAVRWQQLRRSRAGKLAAIDRAKPRTLPVRSNEEADAILRLWDAKARFRQGRR